MLLAQLAELNRVRHCISVLLLACPARTHLASRDWLLFSSCWALRSEEVVQMRVHQIFKVIAIKINDMLNFEIASIAQLGKSCWVLLLDFIQNELLSALSIVN